MVGMAIRRLRSFARPICGAIAAAVIGLGASGAFAQTAGAPDVAQSSGAGGQATNPTQAQAIQLTEIVVTAERRSETVQSASQSITALTGQQLQASGIVSVEQIADQVPGISMKNEGPGQTEYEMRGMSSSGGSSPTVGFYLDDVALTAPAASDVDRPTVDPNLYDLNRVEVLRGPQGTLYGSSSMGGAIRLITNQPDTHAFAATAQVTGSGTQGGGPNYGVSGMVNIPLIDDKLALRLVGTDSYTSGWIDRVALSNFPLPTNGGSTRGDVLAATPSAVYKNANWTQTEGFRATLLWQPEDNLTISPMVMYQKLHQGDQDQVDVPPGTQYEAHYQPYDVAEPAQDEFEVFALPIKYNLGSVQFDSITGYYHRVENVTEENTEQIQDYLTNAGAPLSFSQIGPLVAYNQSHDSQFTQEFRISSTGDSPFQWLAGAYYQHFDSKFLIGSNEENALIGSIFGVSGSAPWYDINYDQKITQYAGFGETSYKLGDFKLTAGLRYYSYDTSLRTFQYGGFFGATEAQAVPTKETQTASGVIPRINLSYTPNTDLTLYTQAAEGFRPGSPLPAPPTACGGTLPTSYQPDKVWSFEGGEKARFFDRRLTVNASVYYEDWTNIQQSLADNACGYDYSGNAGTAHVYGGELETSWRITPEITLDTSLGYTHATLSSVTPAAAATGFEVGQRIQEVPEWTDTTSLVYTHSLNNDYNLVFRGSYEYVDSQQVIVYTTDTVPAHQFVNTRLGLSSTNKVSVWLFANNLTNARTVLNDVLALSVEVPTVNRAIVPQPRTIGLELDFAFGGR